jgi:hypothetical protein
MEELTRAVDVAGTGVNKAAVTAEVLLDAERRIAEKNQAGVFEAMGEMSEYPDSPRSGSSARGSPRNGSARSSTPSRVYDDAAGVGLPLGPPGYRRVHLERRPLS